jgi:Fur family ferric uptake transcriptional regulator
MTAQRKTKQREAIRRVLESAGRPLAPGEVLAGAAPAAPGLGMATVYRNLKAMTADGSLRAVELAGEAARYEVAHLHHHDHFRCSACSRVFDIECAMDGIPGGAAAMVPNGFRVESHELVLRGLCAECASKAGTKLTRKHAADKPAKPRA